MQRGIAECSAWVGSGLKLKCLTRLQKLATDKHDSLFRLILSKEGKSL